LKECINHRNTKNYLSQFFLVEDKNCVANQSFL